MKAKRARKLLPCPVCLKGHYGRGSQVTREQQKRCMLGTGRRGRGVLEEALRQAMQARDDHVCQWCGKEGLSGQDEHMSHVYPRTRDGRLKFDLANVKTLCYQCHTRWHESPAEAQPWFMARFRQRSEYLSRQLRLNKDEGSITLEWYFERLAELRALAKASPAQRWIHKYSIGDVNVSYLSPPPR
jgi:5-methylcytosine-specific restriction endonuclease McrA